MSIDSKLQLHTIEFVDVELKKNPDIDYEEWNQIEGNSIEYKIVPETALHSDDIHSGRLTVLVELFDAEYLEKKSPFFIKVQAQAFFEDTDKENEKNIFESFSVNMLSITYPYIRSFISAFTALSGMQAVTIPPINVLSLISQNEEMQ